MFKGRVNVGWARVDTTVGNCGAGSLPVLTLSSVWARATKTPRVLSGVASLSSVWARATKTPRLTTRAQCVFAKSSRTYWLSSVFVVAADDVRKKENADTVR